MYCPNIKYYMNSGSQYTFTSRYNFDYTDDIKFLNSDMLIYKHMIQILVSLNPVTYEYYDVVGYFRK